MNSSNHKVPLTDFSAILDLRTRMRNNCSVDKYCVLDIFFVLTNFRSVTLSSREAIKTCYINVWCFFIAAFHKERKMTTYSMLPAKNTSLTLITKKEVSKTWVVCNSKCHRRIIVRLNTKQAKFHARCNKQFTTSRYTTYL